MSSRTRKKAKKSGESVFSQSVVESLNCPITAALPVVPVLAEDGRIYERAAIKRWISTKARSPITNAPMGAHLAEASATTRPLVLSAIENGVVEDESAAAWHLGSAKAKVAGDLPGELSSVKIDLDRAGAFASTPEIELLRRAAALKIRVAEVELEAESLAKETESLLREGEAAGAGEVATILGAVEEPGHYEFEHGARRENYFVRAFKSENFERAESFLKSAKMYYKTATDKGHKGAIDALARLDVLDVIVNVARLSRALDSSLE